MSGAGEQQQAPADGGHQAIAIASPTGPPWKVQLAVYDLSQVRFCGSYYYSVGLLQ